MLPVDIEFKDGEPLQVVMTQGKFEILAEIDDGQEQAEFARALGLNREDLDENFPIQVISTGLSSLVVPIVALGAAVASDAEAARGLGDFDREGLGRNHQDQDFPAQQLGKAFDHYDMARDGIADIAYVNPGYAPGRFPIIGAGELPFLLANAKEGSAALDAWYRK